MAYAVVRLRSNYDGTFYVGIECLFESKYSAEAYAHTYNNELHKNNDGDYLIVEEVEVIDD